MNLNNWSAIIIGKKGIVTWTYVSMTITAVLVLFFIFGDPTQIGVMGSPSMILYVVLTLLQNGSNMCITTSNTSYMAGLTGKETVWDLYCGIGTISLFLAQKAGKVYGVEIVPQAIEDAKNNAALNGINNAEFFVGKAEEVLPAFYEKKKDTDADMLHPDVIVVDPPRKGCDGVCLETMLKMQPERIVYVSCDSATLARDLKVLCEGGYELCKVRAVDQFGNTTHVETVVALHRTDM